MRPIAYPDDEVFIIIQESSFEPIDSCKECNGTSKVRYKNYLVPCPVCKGQGTCKKVYKVVSVKVKYVTVYATYCFYEFYYRGKTLDRIEADVFLTEKEAKERLRELTQKKL